MATKISIVLVLVAVFYCILCLNESSASEAGLLQVRSKREAAGTPANPITEIQKLIGTIIAEVVAAVKTLANSIIDTTISPILPDLGTTLKTMIDGIIDSIIPPLTA